MACLTIWPFWSLTTCYSVTLAQPVLCSVWELLLIPARANLGFAKHLASLFSEIGGFLKRTSIVSSSGVDNVKHFARAKPTLSQISVWRSLWKDILSKVDDDHIICCITTHNFLIIHCLVFCCSSVAGFPVSPKHYKRPRRLLHVMQSA